MAGIDTKNGRIAVKGWKAQVALTPDEAIPQLEPHVAAFLYTHVDGEGLMQGFPIETAARLRKLTERQLIVAGGIRSQQEVDALDALGADAVVGMAVYTRAARGLIRVAKFCLVSIPAFRRLRGWFQRARRAAVVLSA